MKNILKMTLIAAALAGGSLAIGTPAKAADVAVTVGVPGIAFGYTDGYWDQGRQWHEWRDANEAARFRAEHRENFFERRHEEERGWGWRDSNHYWERH